MANRKVVKMGNELLRKKAKPVTDFDEDLWNLLDDMKQTMINNDGMGLAGPQVGVLRQIVVMDVNGAFFEMINPQILSQEGEETDTEGCLSVPAFKDMVKRPYKVTVAFEDRYGYPMQITGERYFARCVCHEIDHLNGVLFCDISENNKDFLKKNKG